MDAKLPDARASRATALIGVTRVPLRKQHAPRYIEGYVEGACLKRSALIEDVELRACLL
jgi:hypothetical protein